MNGSLDGQYDTCELDGNGLRSAVDGLYVEIDKLTAADSGAPLSVVVLEQLRITGHATALMFALDTIAAGALQRLLETDQLATADARLLLRHVMHGLDRAQTTTRFEGPTARGKSATFRPVHKADREFELWVAAHTG
jgi:hypothetical protein